MHTQQTVSDEIDAIAARHADLCTDLEAARELGRLDLLTELLWDEGRPGRAALESYFEAAVATDHALMLIAERLK